MIWLVLTLVVVVLGLLSWKLLSFDLEYWKKRGVDYEPAKPIFGNIWRPALQMEHIINTFHRMYIKHENAPFIGLHFFNNPAILIKDIELVKAITVKDFDYFIDHDVSFLDERLDPMFSKNLFSLKGQRWHEMRTTLSPAFTGSKMKYMFQLASDCGEQMAKYFKNEYAKKGNNKIIELDMRDTLSRFTTDAIATIAFGIQIDSLKEKDNEFYKMGKIGGQLPSWKFMLASRAPWILRLFKTGVIPRSVYNFIENLIYDNIKIRERDGINRPDMIQLMLQSRKGILESDEKEDETYNRLHGIESSFYKSVKKINLTNEDIASQAFVFFLAGYETVSTSICFIAQELATHPDIQKRLLQEIDEVKQSCGEKFTYEGMNKLKYMSAVIDETHRLWPQSGFLLRSCTKPYTVKTKKYGETRIERGVTVFIPVYSIQHDPKYFTNPEKFDPDRFSDQNKGYIDQFTYMPFGVGPRFCIGQRLALMETKIALYHLLSNFEIVVTKKTQVPLEFCPKKFVSVSVKKGFFLGIKPRKTLT